VLLVVYVISCLLVVCVCVCVCVISCLLFVCKCVLIGMANAFRMCAAYDMNSFLNSQASRG
jgi:hypothetical protein